MSWVKRGATVISLVALYVVVVVALQRVIDSDNRSHWDAAIAAASTMALVAVTAWYAVITNRILASQERSQEEARNAERRSAAARVSGILVAGRLALIRVTNCFPLERPARLGPDSIASPTDEELCRILQEDLPTALDELVTVAAHLEAVAAELPVALMTRALGLNATLNGFMLQARQVTQAGGHEALEAVKAGRSWRFNNLRAAYFAQGFHQGAPSEAVWQAVARPDVAAIIDAWKELDWGCIAYIQGT